VSEPDGGPRSTPEPIDPADLLGLDVHEAAARANGLGWLVRALEPDAAMTLDYRPGRINLVYDTDDKVIHVSVG